MAKSVNVSILIFIFFNLQLVSVFHAVVQMDPSVLMVMKNVFVLTVSSSAKKVSVFRVTLNTDNSMQMENVNVKSLNLEFFQRKPTFVSHALLPLLALVLHSLVALTNVSVPQTAS